MADDDRFDLARFVVAQESVYAAVTAELAAGRKRTHWMWFVFPQLKGLGTSATAARYGLASLAEAHAYLAHHVLGARLRECTRLVLADPGSSAHAIFGSPDDLKLASSMTLFERAAPAEPAFGAAIERFFGGRRDARTLALLDPAT